MPTRHDVRRRYAWLSLFLVLAMLPSAPAIAADDPVAAVEELLEMVSTGDLTRLDEVVCADQLDATAALFDPVLAFGLPPDAVAATSSLRFRIDEAGVELVSERAGDALVRLTGALTLEIDDAEARELVRALSATDGDEISEEELDFMVPFMVSALAEVQPIADDVRVVLEGDGWLVCGGLGSGVSIDGADEPSVSFEGICGLVPLTEVNARGPEELPFDSSFGEEDYCSYTSSSHELSVALDRGGQLDDYRDFDPGGTDVTIDGRAAYAQPELLSLQLDEGVLELALYVEGTATDAIDGPAYLTAMAMLFAPLISELDVGDDPADGAAGLGLTSLCEAVSPDELAALSPLVFDDAQGDAEFCAYAAADPADGFHVVSLSFNNLSLDDYEVLFPGGRQLTVAGRPAYAQDDQVWVELDEAGGSFSVGALVDGSPGSEGLDPSELAISVAELAIRNITNMDR